MQGVTTAIVGFIFVCLAYPRLVKHRPQFYSAIGLALIIILFDAIAHMAFRDDIGFARVMYVLVALVQMLSILILVLCVGGLSVKDLAGEVANTVEVIRRGEDKPILVPLRGEQPRSRDEEPAPAPPPPPTAPPGPPGASQAPADHGSIPLD